MTVETEVQEVASIAKAGKSTAAKLTMPLKALQKALALVAPAVERRTTIPILENVKIHQQDGAVQFSATNLEVGIVVTVRTQGSKSQPSFLLPAGKVADYVKLLDGTEVTLKCVDERRAELRCGRSFTKLPLQTVTSFPAIAGAPGEMYIALEPAKLDRMLKLVSYAVSTEESRYTQKGALLEVQDGKIMLVATDGHRLARYSMPFEGDTLSLLLPAGFLAAVGKTLDAKSTKAIRIEGGTENVFATVETEDGAVAITHRKVSGQFPNYRGIMPSKTEAIVKVDAETLHGSLRRCITFSDERSGAVKFTVSPSEIKLRAASANAGETDETIDSHSADIFEPFDIGFNAEYLIDALSRLSGDAILRFSALNNQTAMMLVAEPVSGEKLEYVVMPLRVA